MEKQTKIYIFIHCILHVINSARFTASSLSNLVNKLAEGIHRIKCKYWHKNKKFEEPCRVEYKDFHCFLRYTKFKDKSIKYKCLRVKRVIKKSLMKTEWKTYHKVLLFFRKGIHPYEYMDD